MKLNLSDTSITVSSAIMVNAIMLSEAFFIVIECHYGVCCYAECRGTISNTDLFQGDNN
jgi:hypothetical protein